MKWIKVEDELPEDRESVLLWDAYGMCIGSIRNNEFDSENGVLNVTHWMRIEAPLP